MSTNYILSKTLNARDLFDGRLDALGIQEHMTSNRRCLTDGDNFLWVYMNHEGSVSRFSAQGLPVKIVDAIGDAFDTHIFGEHDPQYWGFNTQEEWEVAKKRASDKARDKLNSHVRAYLRAEPSDIEPNAIGETRAKIAKCLVEIDVTLLNPENIDKLLAGIDAIHAAIKQAATTDDSDFGAEDSPRWWVSGTE